MSLRLDILRITIVNKESGEEHMIELDQSHLLTQDAAALRSQASYVYYMLRSYFVVLDQLIDLGAETVARGIRNEERAGHA